MFCVLFEVKPWAVQWDAYLEKAKLLRPHLERIEGFIDNIRYKSLTREGWILSLSNWRDEKALVRWRTNMGHHEVQERGRAVILEDYHLRVGQLTQDTHLPQGCSLREQRLDETEVGQGTTVTLIDTRRPEFWKETASLSDCSEYMGLNPCAHGMMSWDVYEAVLTEGDLILMLTWRDEATAKAFEGITNLPERARSRRVRVVRDYGMFDRREAPQYYPARPPHDEECMH